ncbi:hypothetical protein J7E29_16670 [Streptomyces sp. ISL-90]|nr:hypothetical protein [Streptomyces sp. ISL-90]
MTILDETVPALLLDADLATHHAKNTRRSPRALWLLEPTAEGEWKAVPDFEALRAERQADGSDSPGVVSRDSLLINADMSTIWHSRDHRHPRDRFTVVLTPAGSRIQSR